MRRIITIFTILLFAVTISGCGDLEDKENNSFHKPKDGGIGGTGTYTKMETTSQEI